MIGYAFGLELDNDLKNGGVDHYRFRWIHLLSFSLNRCLYHVYQLSRPEISLTTNRLIYETSRIKREKHTQRDYSIAFKLRVVSQVENGDYTYKQAQKEYGIQGRSTVLVWLRRYGNLEWNKPMHNSKETPAQIIKRLEKELADEKLKSKVLNMMIDFSDKQYGTQIKKKFSSQQSSNSTDKK